LEQFYHIIWDNEAAARSYYKRIRKNRYRTYVTREGEKVVKDSKILIEGKDYELQCLKN